MVSNRKQQATPVLKDKDKHAEGSKKVVMEQNRERLRLYLEETSEFLTEFQRLFEETKPSQINIEQSRIIVKKLQKDFWFYIQILEGKEFPRTKGVQKS